MSEHLSQDEKIVLIAVLKYIVSTDGVITEREIDDINNLAEDAGFKDFQQIFEEVDRKIKSIDDLEKLIDQIKNEKNRLRILEYAIEFSRADADMNPHEIEILKYMSAKWKISLKKLMEE
jgi:hypothetical protein